jgi:hypothetical protein
MVWVSAVRADQEGLQGVYAIDVARSDSIDAAIERAIAEMNFVVRPIARGRLAKTNPRYERIALSRNDATVSVQFDARKPIEMPADGRAVSWVREDGEKFEVSAQWSAAQLIMHFKAEDGERVNTFVLEPDGSSLKLSVKLSSPRLPAPLTYVLAYRRQVS